MTMVQRKHKICTRLSILCMVVFLLTLPVTSAACERAHSKVNLVKSAVWASMFSDGLEDLVVISSEKQTVDELSADAVIDRFALCNRGLPL